MIAVLCSLKSCWVVFLDVFLVTPRGLYSLPMGFTKHRMSCHNGGTGAIYVHDSKCLQEVHWFHFLIQVTNSAETIKEMKVFYATNSQVVSVFVC